MDLSSFKVSNFVLEENLCVNGEKSVKDTIELMAAHGVGHILVCTKKKPHGIFTERDFLVNSARSASDISTIPVNRWASRPMRTIQIDDSVQVALDIFSGSGVRRLPVTDGEGNIVGVCTLQSLLIGLEQLMKRYPNL